MTVLMTAAGILQALADPQAKFEKRGQSYTWETDSSGEETKVLRDKPWASCSREDAFRIAEKADHFDCQRVRPAAPNLAEVALGAELRGWIAGLSDIPIEDQRAQLVHAIEFFETRMTEVRQLLRLYDQKN